MWFFSLTFFTLHLLPITLLPHPVCRHTLCTNTRQRQRARDRERGHAANIYLPHQMGNYFSTIILELCCSKGHLVKSMFLDESLFHSRALHTHSDNLHFSFLCPSFSVLCLLFRLFLSLPALCVLYYLSCLLHSICPLPLFDNLSLIHSLSPRGLLHRWVP